MVNLLLVATSKVSFLFRVLSYHGDIEELSLPIEVIILPNMSLCVPKDMFLDLDTW